MPRSSPNPIYLLRDRDYYESFDSYRSEHSEFCRLVSTRLPSDWRIEQRGIWAQCGSPANATPRQGWKIHISARRGNATQVLSRAMEVLFQSGSANFKFAADPFILWLMNGKNWPRGNAGKFITAYPADTSEFSVLIEKLYQATKGLEGPYILSDHRYKDSSVLFYRYGGMQQLNILNIKGEHVPVLMNPNGNPEPDHRLPYPSTPTWADTPFPSKPSAEHSPKGFQLKGGRYRIDHVISFSNCGGVYCAFDGLTGRKLVIKEARPRVNEITESCDAIGLLKKEYRILAELADTGIAPQPFDLFQEWEHWFLAEEYIEGLPLGAYAVQQNVILRPRAKSSDLHEWWNLCCALARNVIEIIDTLHKRGIVFGDLSPHNLLVVAEGPQLKLIDFEAACQIGVDPPTPIATDGFASHSQRAGRAVHFEDDYYAIGAVLLASIFPINGILGLRPEASQDFLSALQKEMGLPERSVKLVLSLLSSDPLQRPSPSMMLAALHDTSLCQPTISEIPRPNYVPIISDIVGHIQSSATYDRRDRLFPADPKVFVTNPLSLGYGASGVAYGLSQLSGKPPQASVDWILSQPIDTGTYPPGLYLGLAGIAWSLLEMGYLEEAERVFKLTFDHPLLHAASDIFYGVAGWGMTCLRFFLTTQDQMYLDRAIVAGKKLLEMRKSADTGTYWELLGEVRLGFADGASGISLFLLFLYLLTSDSEFLAVAQQALNFDLSFGVENKDGGLAWPYSPTDRSIVSPYWRFGSAGVGAVVLRFWRLLQEPSYFSILEKIFIQTDRKYAVLPGRFVGLAGIGDFLLDMHQFTGNPLYLESAHKVADGIMLFRVQREGAAFPGDLLFRLSCDYGTGSAGIALFLARLQYGGQNQFMLDSLFSSLTDDNVQSKKAPAGPGGAAGAG